MATDIEWFPVYCEYDNVPGPQGKVKVTTLHWQCVASSRPDNPDETGGPIIQRRTYGAVSVTDANRVYTMAALPVDSTSLAPCLMMRWQPRRRGRWMR